MRNRHRRAMSSANPTRTAYRQSNRIDAAACAGRLCDSAYRSTGRMGGREIHISTRETSTAAFRLRRSPRKRDRRVADRHGPAASESPSARVARRNASEKRVNNGRKPIAMRRGTPPSMASTWGSHRASRDRRDANRGDRVWTFVIDADRAIAGCVEIEETSGGRPWPVSSHRVPLDAVAGRDVSLWCARAPSAGLARDPTRGREVQPLAQLDRAVRWLTRPEEACRS